MSKAPDTSLLRSLPQIEEVLKHELVAKLEDALPHEFLADAARAQVDEVRQAILAGASPSTKLDDIAAGAATRAQALQTPSLRRVINASGVIIHTNLGRSVMAPEAVAAVNDAITGYSNLEYDISKMARGSRHSHCEALICAITGAEAAIAVNNNAAAVMMVLSEFAADHEGVVSRGELVEIGGSFRIPDIMRLSNAAMVEVGTTNKTHPADYERAITPETAMLLKVHTSNYRMVGFTESVGVDQMRSIADAANANRDAASKILVYEDQGSGAFQYLSAFGEYAEPTVAESLKKGADLVSFSGDKLLGGPQAGIIVGSSELIGRLKANPLARALRLDKMTLAALEATLRLYLQPDTALERIPTMRMLTETAEQVRVRTDKLHEAVAAALPDGCAELSVVEEVSRAGGGALPMCDIATFALRVKPLAGTAQDCECHLVQRCPVPIVARISDETLLFDGRTLLGDDEIAAIAEGLAAYFASI